MTELPYILEMDPEDWFVEVQRIADELADDIAGALDEYDNPDEVFEALEPKLEPYIIDPDDPTQHQILAEARDDTFYIGEPEPDWFRLTWREDGGYWWFKREEPDEDEPDPGELHRRIGRRVVESMPWGDQEEARERAENQKAKRDILAPYLHAIEEAGGYEATAQQLRDDFRELVQSCLPGDDGVEVQDRSPGEDFTHFVIDRQGQEYHVLAVSPGDSRKPERLEEAFGLDDISLDEGVLVVTDHVRFVWYPFLESEGGASNELMLPADQDDDIVEYNYQIDWTVTQMIRSLLPRD